ncbi:hypothetical protein MKW98_003462 [Papaver atlanticum]|uniref:Uncharacterized protein n=1 Tax=Papaver atlanticum TaxID=357466 RepID=A0AAD4T8R2_9MAGN|nr:hypothetical protein MKW98_003462 [Papaver atlanticum]
MATETVAIPDHTTTEQVEKQVCEVKAVEQEIISPPNENGVEVVEEKPITEELACPPHAVASEEKKDDQPIEAPAVVPVEKVDEVPVLDAQAVDVQKVIEECKPEPDVSSVPVAAIAVVEKEPEVVSNVSAVPVAEIAVVEKEPEVVSKLDDVPVVEEVIQPETTPTEVVNDSISAIEVTEKSLEAADILEDVTPTSEVKVPEPDSKVVEVPEPVVAVEDKSPEVVKVVEEKTEVIEPKEIAETKIPKGKSLEELMSKDQEPDAPAILETVTPTSHETPAEPIEINVGKVEEVSIVPDVVKTADIEVGKFEEVNEAEITKPADVANVVEELATEGALDAAKVEEQKEVENVKCEEAVEVKNVKVEEQQLETAKNEEVSHSNLATEVTEKPSEVETTSRDVEVVPEENREECVKDDKVASVEPSKDKSIDEKTDVVDTTTATATTTVDAPVEETKELVSEEKAADCVETGADKLDKAADTVEENAKPDAPILESSKDVTVPKAEEDLPKQDTPPKAKHSNNIMSKVKQSIVKVKKAIIGKSPSSKTILVDTKEDLKAK